MKELYGSNLGHGIEELISYHTANEDSQEEFHHSISEVCILVSGDMYRLTSIESFGNTREECGRIVRSYDVVWEACVRRLDIQSDSGGMG